MKNLIANQNVKIDNHTAGQKTNGLAGFHIHKRMNGNNKKLGSAEIIFPLDGKASVETKGEFGGRLFEEIRELLSNENEVLHFTHEIYENALRIKPSLTAKELEEIADNILNAFGITGATSFRTLDYRNNKNEFITFEKTYKQYKNRYFVRIKNEYIYIEGKIAKPRNSFTSWL